MNANITCVSKEQKAQLFCGTPQDDCGTRRPNCGFECSPENFSKCIPSDICAPTDCNERDVALEQDQELSEYVEQSDD